MAINNNRPGGTSGYITPTGQEIITNKDIDGGTASNTRRITLPKDTYANLLTLTRKEGTVFYATDLDQVFVDDGTNLIAVGSGGSGTGTLNIVDNPSATSNTTGWTAATNYTVSRDTSNSPLAGVIDTCFAISTTTASSETSTSGVYAASLAMPAALRNTKTQVSIYANIPASSLGVWRMSVYNASGTRMSLSSDSSSVTTLPAGFNGQFVCTFDADSSATYTISFTQTTRTSANTLYVTNISIGNGITAQVPAVGEYESTTSYTIGATTTPPTPGSGATYYRRTTKDGEYAIIRWEYRQTNAGSAGSGDYLLPLPSGLTINYAKVASVAVTQIAGDVGGGTLGTSVFLNARAYVLNSGAYANKVFVSYGTDTVAYGTNWGSSASTLANTTVTLSIEARIPISEWSGNGTVNLGQGAQVQYLYNSGSTTGAGGSDTSSFAYGPGGTSILSINSTTGTGNNQTTFRVRSQYPIQAGSQINVEISEDGNTWTTPDARGIGWVRQGGATFGIGWRRVSGSTTDIDVLFGNAGADPGSGTTYAPAGGGSAWSGFTSYKWRVTIANPSSPVGFGLAGTDGSAGLYKAGQAPGLTTGATIASGYVGERRTSSFSTVSVSTSATSLTSFSNVTAGVYLMIITIDSGAIGSSTACQLSRNSSVAMDTTTPGDTYTSIGTDYTGGTTNWRGTFMCYLNFSSTQATYYALAKMTNSSASLTGFAQLIRIA